MTQPTFSEGPAVPLMVEGLVDASFLQQYASELQTNARITKVQEKAGPQVYAAEQVLTLELGLERLLSGATRALQVQYDFAGRLWTDTILTLPQGYRVVRCQHDE